MARNLIFETLLENYKVGVPEVAERINVPVEELELILSGKLPMKVDIAKQLGQYFEIHPELFFKEQAETAHINIGSASNSNSGFINTYSNDQNNLAIELLSKLNNELKDQIKDLTVRNEKRRWKLF